MRGYKVDKAFGKRVRKIRREIKLSQEKLAEKVGVSTTHMGRVERGVTNPPLSLVEKVAKALRVKSSDLLPF